MTDKISLLLADVDGTLVTEQKILTERAAAAVKSLAKAGIGFAVTSGRPPRGMAMLVEPLALSLPMAGFNGGAFVQPELPDLPLLESRTLRPEIGRRAIGELREQGLDAWLYTGTEWLLRDQAAPHVDREAWTVKFAPRMVAEFTEEDLHQAVKIVGISDDLALVEQAEAAMQKSLGDGASAARSQPYYLDITHPDANKGGVVKWLAQRLGIPTAEIATIGDMPNDVLMFRVGGLSIAMGNASAAVQKQADVVTHSYNDEGFAHAVEHFILGGARA